MEATFEEIKSWEEQLRLLIAKRQRIEEALIIEDDPSRQFKYEEQIKQAEEEQRQLRKKLAGAYSLSTSEGKSLLAETVRGLNIDENEEIGLLHLVNCNRSEVAELFWDTFDEKTDPEDDSSPEHFLYYFVASCTTEMPHSFSERMIYELIVEELEDAEEAVHCVRRSDHRIQMEDLPLGRKEKHSVKAFKKYVQDRFEFASTESFETFIKTGVPRLPYDYVTVVFELHERKWKDFLPKYLKWMMDTFETSHEEVPTFLFFFVFYIDDLHESGRSGVDSKGIVPALKQLAQSRKASLLAPLQPVPKADLQAWLLDIGERNPNKVEVVIEQLVKSLRPEERELFAQKELLHMKDIEEVQRLVYEIANEK